MLDLIGVGAELTPESLVPASVAVTLAQLLNFPIVPFTSRLLESCIVGGVFPGVTESSRLIVWIHVG